MISNEDKCAVSKMSTKNYDEIISEYLSGNWQKFFKIWNVSFPIDFKQSIEYKIMTLKLRVHYAILPIRIVKLHQNIDCVSNCSNNVSEILKNVADTYSVFDYDKELNDEETKLTIDSMKQLEYFFNSSDGQKLTIELKDSPFMTFFALPYIDNPQEDESVNKIFSIDWLEQLTADLESFLSKFYQDKVLSKQELETLQPSLPSNVKKLKNISIRSLPLMKSFSVFTNDHENKFIENKNELISKDEITHYITNKETDGWIAQHHNIIKDNNLCTKSTQTYISTIKAGTTSIGKSHHRANIVIPSIYASNKQLIYNDELSMIKSRFFNLYKHYKKLKLRFHKLHEDYKKMNEVAEVMTISLENSVRGKPINLDMILQSCLKIFPDKYSRNIQTDSEDTIIDLKEDIFKNIFITEEKKNISNTPVPSKLLDYNKIKYHLKCGDTKTKLLLLQALRQKITLNEAEHRDDIIYEYTIKDLLGLQENLSDTNDNNILFHLLQPINLKTSTNFMQQTTSRFLNTLASLYCGRIYLSSSPVVLNNIIMYLDSCSNGLCDAVTLDMLLATLQKMSLQKQQRNYMIEANLVEWLIYHLYTENLRMRSYRLEYASALLMNLSLNSAARFRVSIIAPLFISTIINLLSSECVLILPYINGALQNFLLNNEINKEVKKSRLMEILKYHCTQSDEVLRNHFLHTLKIHENEYNESLSDDDEFPDQDDDLFNILEDELEEDDPVKVPIGELQGENLLAMNYSVSIYFSYSKQPLDKNIVNVCNTKIDNFSSNETESNISTIVTTSESRFTNLKTESVGNKRITDLVNSSKHIYLNEKKLQDIKQEEIEAFLAKPKILRTPPSSAQAEIN